MDSLKKKYETYLVFQTNDAIYAISSTYVVELIWLPELSHIESAPFYIVGYFNFRGTFIPVIDLYLRQGLKTKRYKSQDRILVIEYDKRKFGIHINEVFNVLEIASPNDSEDSRALQEPNSIVEFLVQTEYGMTQVISLEKLVNNSNGSLFQRKEFSESNLAKLFSGLSETEKEILSRRKKSYSEITNIEEYSSLVALVVFELGKEEFAIELKDILEFTNGDGITKIPCVPDHIAGCLNLRGDILILIDILYIIKDQKLKIDNSKKIIIIKHNQIIVGLVVEQLVDVIYLSKDQIMGKPADKKQTDKEFLKGTCNHNNKIIGILDLDKVFQYPTLYVEDYV